MHKAATILLAAGLSRRMGAQNKLLLPIGDKPMIRHVAETYLAATDGPVTLVTGHEADQIIAAVDGLPLNIVHNADFQDGQQSSVATGLRHAPKAQALMIALGDQPVLTPDDITTLLTAHATTDPDKVTVPVCNGLRGNPVVIPAALRPRLLADPTRPGCLRFIRTNPELVQRLDLCTPGFFTDVDTPEAFDTLTSPQPVGLLRRWLGKLAMTPEQADQIRFPCC